MQVKTKSKKVDQLCVNLIMCFNLILFHKSVVNCWCMELVLVLFGAAGIFHTIL